MDICKFEDIGRSMKYAYNPNSKAMHWHSFFEALSSKYETWSVDRDLLEQHNPEFIFVFIDWWNLWQDENLSALMKAKQKGSTIIAMSNLFEMHLVGKPTDSTKHLASITDLIDGFLNFANSNLLPKTIPHFDGCLFKNLEIEPMKDELPRVATLANVLRPYDIPFEAMVKAIDLGQHVIAFAFDPDMFKPVKKILGDSVEIREYINQDAHMDFLRNEVGLVFQIFSGRCLGTIVPKCLELGIPCFAHHSVWQKQIFPMWITDSPETLSYNYDVYIGMGLWEPNIERARDLYSYSIRHDYYKALNVIEEMRRVL